MNELCQLTDVVNRGPKALVEPIVFDLLPAKFSGRPAATGSSSPSQPPQSGLSKCSMRDAAENTGLHRV